VKPHAASWRFARPFLENCSSRNHPSKTPSVNPTCSVDLPVVSQQSPLSFVELLEPRLQPPADPRRMPQIKERAAASR
jgi:hypothetical protein